MWRFCLLLLLSACVPFDSSRTEAGNLLAALSSVTPLERVRVLPDYVYGPDPRQRLDVYMPRDLADSAVRPVLIFGYGGGFTDGRRDEYRFIGEAFTSLGFITVIYDYRLYPQVNFPKYLEDAALVVRWVRDHAPRFAGDPKRLVLAGHSAGAYMAALLATNPAYLRRVGMSPQDLSLVLCLSGGYDFYSPTRRENNGFISADIARVMGVGQSATQPIRFVTGREPPFLLVHGRQDSILPVEQAQAFVRALRAHRDSVAYLEYDLDHASTVTTLAAPLRGLSSVYRDVASALVARGLALKGSPHDDGQGFKAMTPK